MFGVTELMIAALEADLDNVKTLVRQGADIKETDDTGGTPLMWAIQGGQGPGHPGSSLDPTDCARKACPISLRLCQRAREHHLAS